MNLNWLSEKELEWDQQKSELAKEKHRKSLEEVALLIKAGKVKAFLKHHNQEKYPNQWLIVVNADDYPWVVPC